MTKVAAQAQKEALPQGAGTCSLPFLFFPLLVSLSFFLFFFFFTMTLSVLAGADAGIKEPELAIAEEAKGRALSV